MTVRAQTLRAQAQVVAESEPWVRRQCERLEELSRELDYIKGLAWPKRTTGVQGETRWQVGGQQMRQGLGWVRRREPVALLMYLGDLEAAPASGATSLSIPLIFCRC